MIRTLRRNALRSLARTDFYAYQEYVHGYKPAAHHRQMVEFVEERLRRGESGVILAPRGSAKTTTITTGYLGWKIATNPDLRVGLFSQKDKKAEAMSAAIKWTISESEAFKEVFGNLRGTTKWSDSEWVRKGSRWRGEKDRTMVTGGVNNSSAVSKRFDLIACDDILDFDNTYTVDRREKTEDWFWRTMKPAQAAEGVSIIVVGCLATGTPVLMADGTWRAIEQVGVGEQVWSVDDTTLDAGPRVVEAVLDQGVALTYRIRTRTSTVEATGQHPFLCWSEGPYGRKTRGGGPIWKRADEIVPGDYIVEVKESDGEVQFDWMDESFCWLLGFLFGDGWLTRSDVICCAMGSDEAMNQRVIASMESWFPTVSFRRTPFGYLRGDSTTVVGALRELGFNGQAKTKRLPEWLFKSPATFRRAFLRGLCDADGSSTGSSGMTESEALELANEPLIQDVRRLALTCGIRPGGITTRIRDNRAPHSGRGGKSQSWRIHLNFAKAREFELGDGRSRHTTTGDTRLGMRWRLAKVKSVEAIGEQRVWDLTVEGTHTFIADGLAVHNTRWTEGDLYERLIETNKWPSLIIPAIDHDDDGNDVSYWPEVWPLERLYAERDDIGWDNFNCAYQNDLSGNAEGVIFRRDWFDYFDELPRDRRFLWTMGVDLASSEKERADYTARAIVAEDEFHEHWVMGVYRTKIESGHKQFVKDGAAAFPGISKIIIETNQHQSTLVQDLLNETKLPVVGKKTDTDKRTRARAVAARYEAHRVHHHRSLKGGEFEAELTNFPKGHDDQIDALGLAMDINGFQEGSMAVVKPQPVPVGAELPGGSEIRFVTGPEFVPPHVAKMLVGIETARMTREEAIRMSERRAESNYIRGQMTAAFRINR